MSDDPEYDALCQRNDAHRKASSSDHSDEIEMLSKALRGDLSDYTPAGVRTMRARLEVLMEQIEKIRRAA
jgi:hypothetical protein